MRPPHVEKKVLAAKPSICPHRSVVLTSVALLLLTGSAGAALYDLSWDSDFANAGLVPEANPAGWSDTRTLAGLTDNSIQDVSVTLQLAGGWNGDLYAYLVHGSGFAVLLNRPGVTSSDAFGYANPGLNVTFKDGAANGNIHSYQNVDGYLAAIANRSAWVPDGRAFDPTAVVDTDTPTTFLSSFRTLDPNGSWTLFVADLSGGEVSTVVSWGLQIDAVQAVPEPAALVPLIGLALISLAWRGCRHLAGRSDVGKSRGG